jgi:hypothetical protein
MPAVHDIPGKHSGQLDRPEGKGRQRRRLDRRAQGDDSTYERWHRTMGGGEAEDQARGD